MNARPYSNALRSQCGGGWAVVSRTRDVVIYSKVVRGVGRLDVQLWGDWRHCVVVWRRKGRGWEQRELPARFVNVLEMLVVLERFGCVRPRPVLTKEVSMRRAL